MWWKKNKWKVILPVLAAAILVFAFWYGGNAPGLRGWQVEQQPDTPAEKPETPAEKPAEPAKKPEAPAVKPAEPAEQPEEPAEKPEKPAAKPAEPAEKPEKPAEPAENPAEEPEAPAVKPETEPEKETEPEPEKDAWQTDPVPEGKPAPVEPEDTVVTEEAHTCTISISCASILDHMDWLQPEKQGLVPADGWILPPLEVTFYDGESVFNVLRRTCKQEKIHMEFVDTPAYHSAYIEGIHNLYEFDCGERSGWMYAVNGWYPNFGVSRYVLEPGDVIEFRYTCELGDDIGGANILD